MHNVGLLERVVRIIIGLIAIVLAVSPNLGLPDIASPILVILGIILVLTGVVGYCPIFAALGINTCEECKYEEETPGEKAAMAAPAKKKATKKRARAAKTTKAKRTKKKTTRTTKRRK